MIRLAAIVVVVLWPRSPLARDDGPRARVVAPRPPHAKHAPARAGRTAVFARATPDGPRIKMVTGDDD